MTHYTIKELRAKMKPGETLILKKEDSCPGLKECPMAGPNPSITGMRKLYWGEFAKIVKQGQYIYCIERIRR